MDIPHIQLVYEDDIDDNIFVDFIEIVSSENLSLEKIPREKGGPFAGMEWLMPTVIIAYIAKPYFDGFLKEMGKDHYQALKKGFIAIWSKVIGKNAPKIVLVTGNSSPNKVKQDNPYSFYFSIVADAKDNKQFKLLIDTNCNLEEYKKIINTFLDFLEKYHNNSLDSNFEEDIHQKSISRTILVSYEKNINQLKFITLDDIKNKKR